MSKSKRGWLIAAGVGAACFAAWLWQQCKPADEPLAMRPTSTPAEPDRDDEPEPQPEEAESDRDSEQDEN